MARRQARPRPEQERTLVGTQRECPACGKLMRIRYENRRTVVTLNGPVRLRLKIRRCESAACAHRHRTHRPEEEGAIALPQHEFGLDVIARVMGGRADSEAQLVRGYCAAVGSAITDDGRPPLAASGLKLRQRLTAVAESLDRVAEKGD